MELNSELNFDRRARKGDKSFVKACAPNEVTSKKNGKKHLTKKIELADLKDRKQVVRLTLWNRTIKLFSSVGPKIMDRVKIHQVRIKRIKDETIATEHGILPYDLSSNASKKQQFEIEEDELIEITRVLLRNITKDMEWAVVSEPQWFRNSTGKNKRRFS